MSIIRRAKVVMIVKKYFYYEIKRLVHVPINSMRKALV
ncbi:DUF3173 family protein [Enterococcus faecalis]